MTYETEKVQPSIGVFGALEACEDRLVFVKLALLDLNVDPHDILPHDAPRTNIQVSVYFHRSAEPSGRKHGNRPDFRVSHEPIGKSDRKPMSCKRAVRMLLRDGVHVRRRACLDGIALQAFLVSDPPTIVHTIPTQKLHQIGKQFTWRSSYMRQILFFT
jgi:hypothetical protein